MDSTTPTSSSSTSYTVSSPRRTLSLPKKRNYLSSQQDTSKEEREEIKHLPAVTTPITGAPAGPKPSEVYGFVGAITTVVATSKIPRSFVFSSSLWK